MTKLQKQLAYKYKNKEHFKHQITIAKEVIQKLGWKEGTEIEQLVIGDRLILKAGRRMNSER